jgi:S-adenosylmethionine:tRNA ribosyltransferase-isomerase
VKADIDHLYELSAYQFPLPQELIAQTPVSPRDRSRLMIVDRKSGQISEAVFSGIKDLLQPGDSLVFNNTKVIPARLIGSKESGAEIEVLLTRQRGVNRWDALVRPARKLPIGTRVYFSQTFYADVKDTGADGLRMLQFNEGDFWEQLKIHGKIPLPHYIQRPDNKSDQSDYQTVFARQPGAIAAPTAGLHFTSRLLQELDTKGVEQTEVTLHVGIGTFRPVQVEDIRYHPMHYEECVISPDIAYRLSERDLSKRQILVGTTCCRALESASTEAGLITPGRFETNLFIYPGHTFKYARHLLTNFHLPGSTLLMLVSAFAGYELTMEAYRKAIEKRFRFFSYGDAMLIL